MIQLDHAKAEFEEYINHYDITDDKIKLKQEHTFCVLHAADYICLEEKLGEEDRQLAILIALLHDIGRFEQLKKFHSFDDRKFNHAEFGVKVLFEDRLIERFIKDRNFDSIIYKAIRYHSLFALPDDLSERERLHCRIIRDADKLDNFRVKEAESMETLFDTREEMVAAERITPKLLETVRARRCVRLSDRVTHMDAWVSFLAFVFDLNFPASFRWIETHDYLNRNVDRMEYTNPETKRAMEEIRQICNGYIRDHAG